MRLLIKSKGIVLITSVSVLAMLSFLGVSFAKFSLIESKASLNYSNRHQAQLAAQAGIDVAIATIRDGITQTGITNYNYDGSSTHIIRKFGAYTYQYRLKIQDTNCLINVNQPDVSVIPDLNQPGRIDQSLLRMLTSLGVYAGLSETQAQSTAQQILANRPTVSIEKRRTPERGLS